MPHGTEMVPAAGIRLLATRCDQPRIRWRPYTTGSTRRRSWRTKLSRFYLGLTSVIEVAKKNNRKPGRGRRLRGRLFHAGNTKCPICLSDFTSSDVVAGKVTLEHAPPESLKGSAVCLTCSQCNNNASRIDQHAVLAKRASEEWALGQGARVEIDFLGFKMSSRYIPSDSGAPLPTRVSHLRKGSIKLGALPAKELLDIKEGIRFRIPRLSHYESVSMIKAAYLIVFSLMGRGGYGFAQSVALRPVRQQIMNPGKKILTGCVVVKTIMPKTTDTRKQLGLLCHAARPPFWIVPMWDGRAVLLPCGGPEPIDKFVAPEDEIKIENNQLTGWTTCRFDESAAITGSVRGESGIRDGKLLGATGLVPTNKGEWEWMVVDHHLGQYVALPFRPAGEKHHVDLLNVVEMLGDHAVEGRDLDKSSLTRLTLREWSKDLTIHEAIEKKSAQQKTNEIGEGK